MFLFFFKQDWSHEKYHTYIPSNYNNMSPIYLYVDAIKGDNSNIGDINNPFQSIHIALEKSRNYGPDVLKYIILRGGRHYIQHSITLTPQDNNLIIRNYKNSLLIFISKRLLLVKVGLVHKNG